MLGRVRPTLLVATIAPIEESLLFHVHLVDRDGLANRGGHIYEIDATPDHPPTVILTEPQSILETTPGSTVPLRARAQDDFGLTDLRLVAQDADSGRSINVPLLRDARITATKENVTAVTEYLWHIQEMNLKPPATVHYHIQATDNRASGDAAGQIGLSARARIKVISKRQFADRLRDEFASLQKRIRRAWLDQETVKDETTRLRDSLPIRQVDRPEEPLAPKAEEDALALADRQERLIGRLMELARRGQRLRRRMELNQASDAESLGLVGRLQTKLTETASGPLRQALRALDFRRRDDIPHQDASTSGAARLGEAVDQQKAAIKTLRALLRRMDRWEDFRALVTKTRDLIDRQQELRTATTELSRRTIGKRTIELTEGLQGELRQLDRRQTQLAEELETLLNRLRNGSKSVAPNPSDMSLDKSNSRLEHDKPRSASAVAAMENALRAAVAGEVVQHMLDASGAIRTNRLTGAGVQQRLARQGLTKMLARLQERETRRLAELAKLAENALRAAADLLAQQQELLATTREAITVASENQVFIRQSLEQGRLERNALELGRDLGESLDTADAGELLGQASGIMARAKQALALARGSKAIEAQTEAVKRLREATDLLQERARQAAHAAWQKMLAAIRARLEAVRHRQGSINADSTKLVETIAARGRLERRTARQAARLAGSQAEVAQSAEQLRASLARTVVYDEVLKTVVENMQTSRQSLQDRRLNPALASVQKRILRYLDQLIRALLQAEALPPADEFAEGGNGAAGGMSASSQPPIPTAAELLMIKTMQMDLMAETHQLGLTGDGDSEPSEDQLSAIETIGRRQRRLRQLTERLIKEAARRR